MNKLIEWTEKPRSHSLSEAEALLREHNYQPQTRQGPLRTWQHPKDPAYKISFQVEGDSISATASRKLARDIQTQLGWRRVAEGYMRSQTEAHRKGNDRQRGDTPFTRSLKMLRRLGFTTQDHGAAGGPHIRLAHEELELSYVLERHPFESHRNLAVLQRAYQDYQKVIAPASDGMMADLDGDERAMLSTWRPDLPPRVYDLNRARRLVRTDRIIEALQQRPDLEVIDEVRKNDKDPARVVHYRAVRIQGALGQPLPAGWEEKLKYNSASNMQFSSKTSERIGALYAALLERDGMDVKSHPLTQPLLSVAVAPRVQTVAVAAG